VLPFEDKLPFETLPFEEEDAPKAHIPRWPGDDGTKVITSPPEDQSMEARAKRGLKGVGEAALSIGTGIMAPILAPASMAGRGIMNKIYPDHVKPKVSYEDTIDALTYAPQGEIGSKYVGTLGAALQAFPPVGAYVNAPGMIRAGRQRQAPQVKEIPPPTEAVVPPHKTTVDSLPQEVRDTQAFYNRLPFEKEEVPIDHSLQEGLPFTDSVEAVREHQVARDPTGQRDMLVEEAIQERNRDPYQEQLFNDVMETQDKGQQMDQMFTERADQQRMEGYVEQLKGKFESGAIDMDAVQKGLAKLTGMRVQTEHGVGKVVDHKVVLIKEQAKLKAKLDELHEQAFQEFMNSDASKGFDHDGFNTASERARWLQDNYIKNEWRNEPATQPTGRYIVEYPDGTQKSVFGSDIKQVFEGPSRVEIDKRNNERGAIDLSSVSEGISKLARMGQDDPTVVAAKEAVKSDRKRELVYNSIPGLDPFRSVIDTPEKVLAMVDDPKVKDLGPLQLQTAKFVKPGIRTVRVANNNPLIAYAQTAYSNMFSVAENMARENISAKGAAGDMYKQMGKDERVQIISLLKRGDKEMREFTRQELTDAGYSDYQISFYEKVQAMNKLKLDFWNEKRLGLGMQPVKPRAGYFTNSFSGDFWSLAMEPAKNEDGSYKLDKNGDRQLRVVGFVGTDTKHGFNKVVKGLKDKNPDLTFTEMKRRGLSGSFRKSDLAQGMAEMMEWLGKNDPRMEEIRRTIQQVTDEQADAWLGADLHAKSKKGIWGNDGNKPWESDVYKAADESMKSYFTSWEEGVLSHANLDVNANLTAVMKNLESTGTWPRAREYVNKYSRHLTGAYTSQLAATLNNAIDLTTRAVTFDQVGGRGARTAVNQFTKRMGQMTQGFGNVPYTAMQLIQPVATALPEFLKTANSVEVSDSMAAGAAAQIKFVRSLLDDSYVADAETQAMFDYAKRRGLSTFSEFDDVSKTTQSKAGRRIDTAIDINRQAGELGSRPFVFFSFVDMLKKRGDLPESEVFDVAYNMTQYSMTDYHPTERALMYKDMGVVGQLAGSLAQFKHSYINQMVQWNKDAVHFKHLPTWAAGMTAALVLSGYRGLPGYDDADAIVKYLTNLFGDKQTNIADIIAANAPDWMNIELPTVSGKKSTVGEHLAYGAASAQSGVNVSSRLGAAQVLPESPVEALSPYASKAVDIGDAAIDVAKGRNPRAPSTMALTLAPSAVKGLGEEWLATKPWVDNKGRPKDPTGERDVTTINKEGQDDYPRTDFDRSVRKWGVTSLEESKNKEHTYLATNNRLKDEERRRKIAEEVVMKFTQLGPEWLKSAEYVELRQEYVKRKGNPENLVNGMVKGKIDQGMTSEERAKGIPSGSLESIYRYEYHK
jgi:hypothetical protein